VSAQYVTDVRVEVAEFSDTGDISAKSAYCPAHGQEL